LRNGPHVSGMIEEKRARAGGALVERKDERHRDSS
jgi:hypothetical protein